MPLSMLRSLHLAPSLDSLDTGYARGLAIRTAHLVVPCFLLYPFAVCRPYSIAISRVIPCFAGASADCQDALLSGAEKGRCAPRCSPVRQFWEVLFGMSPEQSTRMGWEELALGQGVVEPVFLWVGCLL